MATQTENKKETYTPAYTNSGGTNATPAPKAEKSQAQIDCEKKGGRWDILSQSCILPDKPKSFTETNQPIPPELTLTNQPQTGATPKKSVVFNQDGTVTVDGKTISKQEYSTFLGTQGSSSAPGGMITPGIQEIQQGRDPQVALQQKMQQLAQQGMITPEELGMLGQQFENNGALAGISTTGAAFGGALSGATTLGGIGAGIGSVVPGIGTAIGGGIGAGIGAIVGGIGGAFGKKTIQKRQSVKEANKNFSSAKTNKDKILNYVNQGLVTEGQARSLWAAEKESVYSSYAYLKRETQNDLNNFLGQPGDDLIAIENYLALDMQYDLELEKALMQPNPLMIRYIAPEQNE